MKRTIPPLVLGCALATLAPAQVELIEIADGGSSTFGFSSFPNCISADGRVVCGQGGAGVGGHYRWEDGVGIAPLIVPGLTVDVYDLTADGGLMFGTGGPPPRVALQLAANGAFLLLDTPQFGASSRISDVSDDGTHRFGQASPPMDSSYPAYWDPSGARTVYLTLADGTPAWGLSFSSCSANGQVAAVGARLWTPAGGIEGTPSLPGTAMAFSEDGGVAYCWGDQGRAFRVDLNTGQTAEPGEVPGARTPGVALARVRDCTASGDLAIGWTPPVIAGGLAFSQPALWHRDTGPFDLRSYVTGLGLDVSGYSRLEIDRISGDGTVIAGAGVNAALQAVTFLLRFPGDWWSTGSGQTYCTPGQLNSTGESAHLVAFGTASLAANNLRLEVHGLPPSQFGFFVSSRTQGFLPAPGGSMGDLCLGGAIGRHIGPGEVQSSGPQERALLAIDLQSIPTPTGFAQAQAGETWNFQFWHRDTVAGLPTSNFSDAVSVTIEG